MSPIRIAAVVVGTVAAALVAAPALAGQTADQVVTYEVTAIDEISVAGAPSLTVTGAAAGSAPGSATASGTYSVTTNGTGMKITAELDEALPAGVVLSAALAAPAGAVSVGAVELSTTPQDVVTGITEVAESGLAIDYELTAAVTAGVVSGNRTITYTITTGS